MKRIAPAFAVVLVAAFALVACSQADVTASSPTTSTAPTTSTSTAATSTTTVDTIGEGPLFLRPIDPTTLKDLLGKPQLGVGRDSRWAVSGDGRWLALANSKVPNGGDRELVLVDRHTWSWAAPVELLELRWIHSLAVTDEGTAVWLEDPHDRLQLYQLPAGADTPELLYTFEPTRWPISELSTPDALTESTLTLLTHEWGQNHGGFASVLQIDLDTGEAIGMDLPEVWYGGLPPETTSDGVVAPTLEPGWVFDGALQLLYVVPADRDELIVVDLQAMQIVRRGIWVDNLSLLDRLVQWWIPPARAKGGDFTRRHLALSPDGSRLLVATEQTEAGDIVLVDTDSFQVVASRDFPTLDISFSPDGSTLIAIGWFQPEPVNGSTGTGGIHLLDPENLETLEVVLPDLDFFEISGFSPESSHLYASSHVAGSGNALLHVVIDLADPRPIAWRKVYWPGFAIPQAGVLAADDR